MTTMPAATTRPSVGRQMLNKVPEVTVYFWIIKVLCTTIGETGADNLDQKYNLGLANLTYITGGILALVLVFVFSAKRYVPALYWAGIVLISVVGTLITDNLTDNHGVALQLTTAIFSICLAVTFAVWYASERTLSIHSIITTRREAFSAVIEHELTEHEILEHHLPHPHLPHPGHGEPEAAAPVDPS